MVDVVIFAGGVGSRMGSSIPKQFLEVDNKPIIIHTIEKYDRCSEIDQIVVVCKKEYIEQCQSLLKKFNIKKVIAVIEGGNTGQESIFNGVDFFYNRSKDAKNDIVMMHDGVRPVVDDKLICDCIKSVKSYGNAIAASLAIETIIRVDESNIMLDTVDRSCCRYAKAPQSFILDDIWNMHKRAIAEGRNNIIDSASLMSSYGVELHIVECPQENIKITTPNDFYMFKAMYEAEHGDRS